MRIVILLGLLLAACAHQKVYTLGKDLTVVTDGLQVEVNNERLTSYVMGMPKSPLFMARPGKEYATTHCLEGFYNPDNVYLGYSGTADAVRPFALCRDPAPGDAAAFLLSIRERDPAPGSSATSVKQFQFTARVIATGATDVQLSGADVQRVHLPTDSEAFRTHPEIIGALVTLGVLPPEMVGTLKR
ncbi:MAG TPA: hypothetical protein VH083_12090 [Myxococcales bacterium]|nr:hypothetical protein [Myxococcales bacterium]